MTKTKAVAVRRRTPVVNLSGKMKTGNKGEKKRKRMRTERREGGKQAAAVVRAARTGQENCEMRKRSLAVTMTVMTTSPRTQLGAAGKRAVEVTMKEATEEAAGVAVPLQHTVTAAVTTQRPGRRAEVEAREAQTPVMPVTVNKICGPDSMEIWPLIFSVRSVPNMAALCCCCPFYTSSIWGCSLLMITNIKFNLCARCSLLLDWVHLSLLQFLFVDLAHAPVAVCTSFLCFCLSDI